MVCTESTQVFAHVVGHYSLNYSKNYQTLCMFISQMIMTVPQTLVRMGEIVQTASTLTVVYVLQDTRDMTVKPVSWILNTIFCNTLASSLSHINNGGIILNDGLAILSSDRISLI